MQRLVERFDEIGSVNVDFNLFSTIFAIVFDELVPIMNCSKASKSQPKWFDA